MQQAAKTNQSAAENGATGRSDNDAEFTWRRYLAWLLAYALGGGTVAVLPLLTTLLVYDLSACQPNGWARFLGDLEGVLEGFLLPVSGAIAVCFLLGSALTYGLWTRQIGVGQGRGTLGQRVGMGVTVACLTLLGLIFTITERQLVCLPLFIAVGFTASVLGRVRVLAREHEHPIQYGGHAAAIPLLALAIGIGILGIGLALFGIAMVGCGS